MKTIALIFALCVSALSQTQASSPPVATPVQEQVHLQPSAECNAPQVDVRFAECQIHASSNAVGQHVGSEYQVTFTIQVSQNDYPNVTPASICQDDYPIIQRGRKAPSTEKNSSAQSINLVYKEPKLLRIKDRRRQLC